MTVARHHIVVSADALRHNVHVVRQQLSGRALIAVVKADAYGLGIERCVPIYASAAVDAFAVASLSEAERVRALAADARIIVLSTPLPQELPGLVALSCEIAISSVADWYRLREAITDYHSSDDPLPIHIFVDTGMGRTGCAPHEVRDLITTVTADQQARIVGFASHYPAASEPIISAEQEVCWQQLVAEVSDMLPEDCWYHLANSEGAVHRPVHGNAVRVGLLLAGVEVTTAEQTPWGLQQAITWHSAITLVKILPAGHGVSYHGSQGQHHLTQETRIGLVPVGYADGYPLGASDRSWVGIAGQPAAVLGRVTMDYLMVDLSQHPRAEAGTAVTLCAPNNHATSAPSLSQLAHQANTIPYDILCGLRGRCDITLVESHFDHKITSLRSDSNSTAEV